MTSPLEASLQSIKGVGPKLAELFSQKGVETIEDALFFLPRTYEDRSKTTPLGEIQGKGRFVVRAKVEKTREFRRGRMYRFEAIMTDGTGTLVLLWFRGGPYLAETFQKGRELLICGDARPYKGIPSMTHPDYELIGDKPSTHFRGVVPVYSETEGLNQKAIRRVQAEVVRQSLGLLEDPLPAELRDRLVLPSLRQSFQELHFPSEIPGIGELSPFLKRVIFEEFFVMQLALGMRRRLRKRQEALVIRNPSRAVEDLQKQLTFDLTGDQKKAIAAICEDLSSGQAMSRLVQGDVGSGKTLVALAAAAVVAKAGYQTAFMAPTEILAHQHLRRAKEWLEPLGIKSVLCAQGAPNRSDLEKEIAAGKYDLVIGTHALFQQTVGFKKLALTIVDEQHRFGVNQRMRLVKKGVAPHLLMMTATPIPRTLALTLYGDLDVSLITEKPPGRAPVKTSVWFESERPKLFAKIRQVARAGGQVFIIYPLVEASEKIVLKSATEMHEKLSKEVFADLSLGLVHGKMKADEKERVLTRFRSGEISVLISTTVVEVGIDVPAATLMVIEHPERLGLSQLHQLRGRVGRGGEPGECILMTERAAGPRLRALEKTEDGFEIAEVDLSLRGPGEFLGIRQSGLPGFRIADMVRDVELLSVARLEAERILDRDPELSSIENSGVKKMLKSRWSGKIERLRT